MDNTVLLFSDLHLHEFPFGSSISSGGYHSRLSDGLSVLDRVYTEASQRNIRNIIFCGDLFHTRQGVSSQIFNRTFKALTECSMCYPEINLFLLLGNHDFTRDMNFNSIESFNLIPRVKVIVDIFKVSTMFPGINMLFVPYTPYPEKFKASLDMDYDVAFVHQGFSDLSVDPRNYYIDEIASVESMSSWGNGRSSEVISGHYHDHSLLTGKDRDLFNLFGFFVGSPMQHSFKDVGCNRGFVIYTLGSRNPEFHSLSDLTPLFVDVFADTELSSVDITGNFVRVSASNSNMNDLVDVVKSHNPIEISRSYIPSAPTGKSVLPSGDVSFRSDIFNYVRENGRDYSRNRLLGVFEEIGGDL